MLDALQDAIIDQIQKIVGPCALARDESLFALGLDSVQVMQIFSLVQDQFDVELDVERAFEDPSVRGIAKLVDAQLTARIEAMTEEEVSRLLQQAEQLRAGERNA